MGRMLWTPEAEAGAAHAWGERHVGLWVLRRTRRVWLPALPIVAGVSVWYSGVPAWVPDWPWLGGVVVVTVVAAAVGWAVHRRTTRGYPLPRRRRGYR